MNIHSYILSAIESSDIPWIKEVDDKVAISHTLSSNLIMNSEMLEEYFKITIDKNGLLHGIPELIQGYCPYTRSINVFLLRLATEVSWNEELSCFNSIANILAQFYKKLPPVSETSCKILKKPDYEKEISSFKENILSSIFFPAFRSYLIAPSESERNSFPKNSIVSLSTLEKLYKVFERC
jgi:DNA mismatch repair protein MLH1